MCGAARRGESSGGVTSIEDSTLRLWLLSDVGRAGGGRRRRKHATSRSTNSRYWLLGVWISEIAGVGCETTGRVRVPHGRGTATVAVVGWEGAIRRRVRLAGYTTASIGWWVGRVRRWARVVVAWCVVELEMS